MGYIIKESLIENLNKYASEHYNVAVNSVIENEPTINVVSMYVYEQVRWERDIAIKQLESIGLHFGQVTDGVVKVVKCDACKYKDMAKEEGDLRICPVSNMVIKEDSFCNYGDRKR